MRFCIRPIDGAFELLAIMDIRARSISFTSGPHADDDHSDRPAAADRAGEPDSLGHRRHLQSDHHDAHGVAISGIAIAVEGDDQHALQSVISPRERRDPPRGFARDARVRHQQGGECDDEDWAQEIFHRFAPAFSMRVHSSDCVIDSHDDAPHGSSKDEAPRRLALQLPPIPG